MTPFIKVCHRNGSVFLRVVRMGRFGRETVMVKMTHELANTIADELRGTAKLKLRKKMNDWISCSVLLPKLGRVVSTKIDDANGSRNEQPLKRGGNNGRLWFFPDGSMYVYYTPTHWREVT